MCNGYFHRVPRSICIGEYQYWIEAKIKKGEDEELRNKAFNFFIEEIKRGVKFEKAKKRVWNKYRVKIDYDEEAKNGEENVTPKKGKLKVTVE